MSRTIAIMKVSPESFREIHEKLERAVGYEHAFGEHDGQPTIDMDGLALSPDFNAHREFSPPPGFVEEKWRERLRKLAALPRDDVRGAFCSPAMLDDVQKAIERIDALEGRKPS
jgi:hypothetical protein